MDLQSLVREVPDFPQPGIRFRDITTLLRDPAGLREAIDRLHQRCTEATQVPDYVVGIESRGFLLGPVLAYRWAAGFVPARKPGKLPAAVRAIDYELEYSTDRLEIHQDALLAGSRVLVVDDLLATGGTARATGELVQQMGCQLLGFGFIVELRMLGGRQKLPDVPVTALMAYDE